MSQLTALSFQVMVEGRENPGKASGLPELRRQSRVHRGKVPNSRHRILKKREGQNTEEERIQRKRALQIFRGSSLSIQLSSYWPCLRANYPGLGKESPETIRGNDTWHSQRSEIVPVPNSKTRKPQNWWGIGWVP